MILENIIFRAGCDSRSAVQSASAQAQDLVKFQNRQYSLDERRRITYFPEGAYSP